MKRSLSILRNAQFWTLLWVYAWLGISSQPPVEVAVGHDLYLHFAANLALFLSGRLVERPFPGDFVLSLLLFGFSLSVETAQFLVPGRFPDFRDVLANLGGLLTGVAAVHLLRRYGYFHRPAAE